MAENEDESQRNHSKRNNVIPISGMYENWFLDYASYVILERAVPAIEDGFKPVQRRIMHAMKEMDDGRFNKVANIIGNTMQYHPHGDAAIGDAIVHLGQKDFLIETQGNWGDINTGDGAAAARYIEARLSKLANAIVFNPQTTQWQLSYDGRKNEPINLPVKFPLLLAQGVEGIAVGLSTKIMPHNFIELCDASIKVLQGKQINIFPDFLTGGSADFSNYNEGLRGGKIRVRGTIDSPDKKTIIISSIPYGTTTTSVIESIVRANENGKIKIKKVIDNTAEFVEILVDLHNGVSPDLTIDALYAFTDCEVSISPNACVIIDDKPHFMSVNDLLKISAEKTVNLLKLELEIRRNELLEKIFFSSLEKIFIQEEMYIDFKKYDNKPDLFVYLNERFEPFKKLLYREIKDEDFEKLTQIPMIRITRFDSSKADEKMKGLENELKQVEYHLEFLIEYAIEYFDNLKKTFGPGRERKTIISAFENIRPTVVAANNAKLYVNRTEGFVGTGLKKDEFVIDCSDIDDIIVFRKDGKYQVVRISDKVFVGKDIIHVDVWKKGDERMVYNSVYIDGVSGHTYVKRFQVMSVTRDKEYDITKGSKKSQIIYFTANPNGEAESVNIFLTSGSSAKKKAFDFDFKNIAIKGRAAGGNILTKYPIRRIELKTSGISTLAGLKIWYDESIGRLNRDERGEYLGEFNGDDLILVLANDGSYELTSFEITNRYDAKNIVSISKFDPEKVISAVHYDGGNKTYYVKRFKIETSTLNKKFVYISEKSASRLSIVSLLYNPKIDVVSQTNSKSEKINTRYSIVGLIDVKGWKAIGNKLTNDKVLDIKLCKHDPDVEKRLEDEDFERRAKTGNGTQSELKLKDTDHDQLNMF